MHALPKSINNWLLNVSMGKANAVTFLSPKKAVDTADHDILLEELSCYRVAGQRAFYISILSVLIDPSVTV